MPLRVFLTVAALSMAACAQFPELDAASSPEAEAADFPALIPIETALATAESAAPPPEETRAQIDARVAALRARAAALRARPRVSDPRLRDAVAPG